VFKTRAQWLAEAKASDRARDKAAATRYEAMEVDDLAVRVYGDTAVATGRTTPRGQTAKGQPMISLARARKLGIAINSSVLLNAQVLTRFAWGP